MKIIDTHCHPYMNKEKKISEITQNFFKNNGESMIVIGTDIETSIKAVDLSKNNKNIHSTIGIHPCDVENLDLEKTYLQLENLILQNKGNIVAIGETGLDYYWMNKDEKILKMPEDLRNKALNLKKKLQELFFKMQISLAKKYDLPIVIHNRDSKEDILRILKEENFKNFIFHCYSENLDYAKEILSFSANAKISFSGIITFKNAKEIQKTAKCIPLKNILAETDSPFLTPMPYRGKEENEPIYTKYVIEKISELRGETIDFVSEEIYKNSKKTFKI